MRSVLSPPLALTLALACSGEGKLNPNLVSPADLHGFWYTTDVSPRVLQFAARDDYWDPQIAGDDVYIGYDGVASSAESVSQGGNFTAADGLLTLNPTYELFGRTEPAELTIEALSDASLTLTSTQDTRVYARTEGCPITFTRAGVGRDGSWVPSFSTETIGYLNGGLAMVFDHRGYLHALLGQAGRDAASPRYATTEGGCGARVWDAPNSASTDMAVDDDDTVHAAMLTWDFNLIYGTKVAGADGAAWVWETIAPVLTTEFSIGLELRPDGSPVVVSGRDVYERDGASWTRRERPVGASMEIDTALTVDGRLLVLESGPVLAITEEQADGSFVLTRFEDQPGNAVTTAGIAVDAQGRVHVVTGDSVMAGFQTYHGLYHGVGTPTALTFEVLGIGTDPKIRIDPTGVIHVWATRHRQDISGLYYRIDGDDVRTVILGDHNLENYSRGAMAVSDEGVVAVGETRAQLWLDDLAPSGVPTTTVRFNVDRSQVTDAALTVNGVTCADTCDVPARTDEVLRLKVTGAQAFGANIWCAAEVCQLLAIPQAIGAEPPTVAVTLAPSAG